MKSKTLMRRLSVAWAMVCVCAIQATALAQQEDDEQLKQEAPRFTIERAGIVNRLVVDRSVVRETTAAIESARVIHWADSTTELALWQERDAQGSVVPFYSIDQQGKGFTPAIPTSYEIKLQHGDFDPLDASPRSATDLPGAANGSLYIVQFEVQPLEEFRERIRELGGEVRNYLPHHAHIVRMNDDVRAAVEELPFVRWVGWYRPIYRLEAPVLANVLTGTETPQRYRIQVFEEGAGQKQAVAEAVSALGGIVHDFVPSGILLDATLTSEQLKQIAARDDVLFIGPWGPPVAAMNNVRIVGGADYVESVAGYTGLGVRGEIMDNGCQIDHPDYASRIEVRLGPADLQTHGTSTFGIVFGDGSGNANARGMMPQANGVFSMWSPADRYTDVGQLRNSTWQCVFQSNSWGTSPFTATYTAESSELDRAVFDFDVIILQAQGNYGGTSTLRQAWGKNIVSVGGINHRNTLSKADDGWFGDASIGPAYDGRIKPDLSFWYDNILTTTTGDNYTYGFGGTSAATPETAGHFGLFFQMWSDGIFGNPVNLSGTVYQNRPHASTAKAVMINTAVPYDFSGTGADLTRVHQGWGLANVAQLYDLRNNMQIVNETETVENFETIEHARYFESGAPMTDALRATLVWTDIEGTTAASQHRINNLDLRVTSPSGVIYYGNNGLLEGNWSTSGGSANTIDTVENVFVQSPESGIWRIDVIGAEINEDGHVETPEVDADYALVISGGADCPAPQVVTQPAGVQYHCYGEDIMLSASFSDYTGLQWYFEGAPLDGETGPTLEINDFQPEDEGGYWLEATNDCVAAHTDMAMVLYAGTPVVTQHPASVSPRCAGSTVTFTVAASGTGPLTYQWFHDGQLMPGATQSAVSLIPAMAEDAGEYFCRIANNCGSVDSNAATLVINPTPFFIEQPADSCGSAGGSITLTVDATPASGVYYQWRKVGVTGALAGGKTLTLTDVDAADAGEYYVVAFTLSPTCTTESEHAAVDVATSPVCGHTAGDMDDDGDYDLADMQQFMLCFGSDVSTDFCCACANVDELETAIDAADWAALEGALTGPQ